MERDYIIHKGWPSERPEEPELSETAASDDPLCKAIGPINHSAAVDFNTHSREAQIKRVNI